jgi:hypothetical protein
VAVGGSDEHDPLNDGGSVGHPTTVVWASSLSEDAIVAGLKSGRVFIRSGARHDTFIDLQANGQDGRATAEMGQTTGPGRLTLTARIRQAAHHQLIWIRRGQTLQSSRIAQDDATLTLSADAVEGDWFSVLVMDGTAPSLISNAIFVGAPTGSVTRGRSDAWPLSSTIGALWRPHLENR